MSRVRERAREIAADVAMVIAGILAAGLLGAFLLLTYKAAATANTPPRLADPAPTAAPTPNEQGQYPPQLRGDYDPDARLLGLLAVVTPLLTTIVGFYFGARASAAPQVEQARTAAKAAMTDAVNSVGEGKSTADVRQALRTKNLIS
jgi:hypothetical protein